MFVKLDYRKMLVYNDVSKSNFVDNFLPSCHRISHKSEIKRDLICIIESVDVTLIYKKEKDLIMLCLVTKSCIRQRALFFFYIQEIKLHRLTCMTD